MSQRAGRRSAGDPPPPCGTARRPRRTPTRSQSQARRHRAGQTRSRVGGDRDSLGATVTVAPGRRGPGLRVEFGPIRDLT